MSEAEMRRCLIDLILWTSPDRMKCIWSFVSSYLSDEKVGIHADEDYLIAYTDYLNEKRRKAGKKEKTTTACAARNSGKPIDPSGRKRMAGQAPAVSPIKI